MDAREDGPQRQKAEMPSYTCTPPLSSNMTAAVTAAPAGPGIVQLQLNGPMVLNRPAMATSTRPHPPGRGSWLRALGLLGMLRPLLTPILWQHRGHEVNAVSR